MLTEHIIYFTEGLKEGTLHPGVTCDGCEKPVIGFRYKCVQCPDYDLCEKCEAKRIHPGHNMMRIATPEGIWPQHFFRRLNKMHDRINKRAASASTAAGMYNLVFTLSDTYEMALFSDLCLITN